MQTSASTSRLTTVLEMIKFEHTIFALTFALLGAVLAAEGMPSWGAIGWIVVAMVGARSAAMGFNRLVDRKIDAANPRPADRALPRGAVSPLFVSLFVLASSALLVLAAWRLNPLALKLSPVALIILLGYSYTKRFTPYAHVVLGLALAGAPLGAWIAIRGDLTVVPIVLASAVILWVAGFDTLYALQDVDYDRDVGLHSIPSRFGVVPALWISTAMHVGTLGLLAAIPTLYLASGAAELGPIYWVGWIGCALLLAVQHWIVRPDDLSRLNAAFFQANGLLAVWFFLTTVVALWRATA